MAAASPVYPYTIRGESAREHPDRFTQIYQLEVHSGTGETIEVAIDPAVYRDDWDQPYEEDLNHYLHCNDRFYNDRIIMRDAVFLNDRRYEDPNFRAHQVERYFTDKMEPRSHELAWIHALCPEEVRSYAEEHNYSQYTEQFQNFRTALMDRYIQKKQKERLDAMNPLDRTVMKAIYALTDFNEKIIDFVGDKNDPEAQGKRKIARSCINLTYTAGSLFFFRYLLGSAYSKPR
ncbi:MAG: hypothetical protein COT84_08005 [Chlamydiae bacterium CG10_big_fil_rev_8_21_14_0_10_35_9]|nr:MAG: hypothetical protein COT84_08005 [Chlamydiae bacterium CG10_big_fil_rev_8_21_14_0_10_35_9]